MKRVGLGLLLVASLLTASACNGDVCLDDEGDQVEC